MVPYVPCCYDLLACRTGRRDDHAEGAAEIAAPGNTGGKRIRVWREIANLGQRPAADGKANRAVCELLADKLDRRRSSVRIVTGTDRRAKLLAVTGD